MAGGAMLLQSHFGCSLMIRMLVGSRFVHPCLCCALVKAWRDICLAVPEQRPHVCSGSCLLYLRIAWIQLAASIIRT